MVTLVYLGRLVDLTGTPEEKLELPKTVQTTADLRDWLNKRFPDANPGFDQSVRIALDNEICSEPATLGASSEIALMPPVGGG